MIPPAAPAPTGPGLFVALEGGDGAGKSTQARRLADWLTGAGHEVVLTHEPGDTELGRVLRRALLHGDDVDARTEALLFATDRAHHVAAVVRPALVRGAVVVTDRYLDSSVAYQGGARGLGVREVRELNLWATGGLLPALTVVLDLDPGVAAGRRGGAPDRLEREAEHFHARVRRQFLALAAAEADRYLVLDASRPAEELAAAVRARVAPLLAGSPA